MVATVSAWFPDKKGLCSGCLMMGFGASALVLGNWASSMFEGAMGWRRTYVILGLALGAVLILTGLILKRPAANQVFPRVNKAEESSQVQDFTSGEMLRRPSFWMAFFYLVCLSAVGSSVISFARDLALSVGAPAALATSLVGALSICNGLGRMATGAAFDALGRRKTMLIANCLHHLCRRSDPHCHVDWYLGAVCFGTVLDGTELWLLLHHHGHIPRCVLWHEALSHQCGLYDVQSHGRLSGGHPVQSATDRHRRLCGALPPPSGLDGGGLGPEFGAPEAVMRR